MLAACVNDAAVNLALAGELKHMLCAAQARGIPCIPLRGVALSEQLYGNVAVRPTGDIDVLIPKQRLPDVRRMLEDLGFSELDVRPNWAERFDYTLEFHKEGEFPVIVEPHWSILYPPYTDRIPMEAVWDRCEAGTFLGFPVTRLCPEHLLIHLCLHILHHDKDASPWWWRDLHHLLLSLTHAFDWRFLLETVQQARLEMLLHPVFQKLVQTFHTPVPDSVLSALAHARVASQDRWLVAIMTKIPRAYSRERLATFVSLKGAHRKLRYAFSLVFPCQNFMKVHYGVSSGWMLWLLYLKRFSLIFWHGMRGIGGMVIRGRRLRGPWTS